MTRFVKAVCLALGVSGVVLAIPTMALAASSSELLQIAASGDSSYVRGYGAYLDVNYDGAHDFESAVYCDNVPPGDSSPDASRVAHDPNKGYWCMTFSLSDLRQGADLIALDGIKFLSISAPELDAHSGGHIYITFVRKVGITGLSRRVIDILVSRERASDDFTASFMSPNGTEPFDWMGIGVSTTFGLPSGVSQLRLYNGSTELPAVDLDNDLQSP